MALKIFEDIKLIRGYNRSVLADFTNNNFEFIDSNLCDLLLNLDEENTLQFSDFVNKHLSHKENIEQLYIKNIFNEFYSKDAVFPKIKERIENPFAFQSITIYISSLNIDFLINNFIKLNYLTANIFFIINQEFVDVILNLTKRYFDYGTRYIFCSEETILKIIKINLSENVLAEYHIVDFNIIDNKERYLETWPSLFNNFSNYYESSIYNVGVYEKVFIDQIGGIKINLHDDFKIDSIFNVDIDNLESIVKSDENYRKHVTVNVDNILVCRDCEFRRMCVDITGIKPTKYTKDFFIKEKECNYNPYINKWKGSEDYKSLTDSGIIANEETFLIDHKKVEELNNDLWCD